MANNIELIKLLEVQKLGITKISQALNLSTIKTLSLIGETNNLSKKLIISNLQGEYFLTKKISWLDSEKILKQLAERKIDNYNVEIFTQINSTNDYAINNIAKIKHQSIISTEYQYRGRGRTDKYWNSEIAHDITMSICYLWEIEFEVELLPLVIAIATYRLLKSYKIISKIKWPNDIYVNNNKVGGILVESGIFNAKRFVICGIGLNNFKNFERNKLISGLVFQIDKILKEFQLLGFVALKQEWLDHCLHLNKNVEILKNNKVIHKAIHYDLSYNGNLILKKANKIFEINDKNISLVIPSY